MTIAAASLKSAVTGSLHRAPIIAVVRHADRAVAARQARAFLRSGLEMIEITFTVPRGADLVRELLAERPHDSMVRIGMGTVTTAARAKEAVAAGSEFLVTPNVSAPVADVARSHDLFLCMGALTPSELVAAHELGADLLKVYPLPLVGGPAYLARIREPLGDLAPMLAGGGFGIEEIPAYRAAGASAFGIGGPLLGNDDASTTGNIHRALSLARAEQLTS
ncbi:MAG: 2-dehydro-3-deoxyphosphogluconate aldolase [Thermoanaerobaculia bacterium]